MKITKVPCKFYIFYCYIAIIDIGSASFKYDMRRLTEILAFPKAWYRRTIVRRLFLGDVSLSAPSEPEKLVTYIHILIFFH